MQFLTFSILPSPHLLIYCRLANLSRKSKCLVQAIAVQMPLHHYEDALHKLVENEMGAVPISFVENSAQRTLGSSSPFDLLGSYSPTLSPGPK
jgi:hypothetical protein